GLTANAFNPVGGGASLVQMLSPTAIDPIVALAENKDWTGKPIAKTSYNKATPGHALVKDTASAPSKVLSEAINLMTGG
ncbi:LPD38 domain-containing protein, partial [Streptomyces caeruleatus]